MLGFVIENMSFIGRASRLDFWLVLLLGPFIAIFVAIPLSMATGMIGVFIVFALFTLVYSGMIMRRIRDKGMSLHWAWLFLLVPNALGFFNHFLTGPLAAASGVFGLILFLWTVVEFGILSGSSD